MKIEIDIEEGQEHGVGFWKVKMATDGESVSGESKNHFTFPEFKGAAFIQAIVHNSAYLFGQIEAKRLIKERNEPHRI